jgi:hypothetical protein
MASDSTLKLARRLILALGAHQSQGALASQAKDCAPIVEALGYYDLGNYLRDLTEGKRG